MFRVPTGSRKLLDRTWWSQDGRLVHILRTYRRARHDVWPTEDGHADGCRWFWGLISHRFSRVQKCQRKLRQEFPTAVHGDLMFLFFPPGLGQSMMYGVLSQKNIFKVCVRWFTYCVERWTRAMYSRFGQVDRARRIKVYGRFICDGLCTEGLAYQAHQEHLCLVFWYII